MFVSLDNVHISHAAGCYHHLNSYNETHSNAVAASAVSSALLILVKHQQPQAAASARGLLGTEQGKGSSWH